jgi:hypothetical protein
MGAELRAEQPLYYAAAALSIDGYSMRCAFCRDRPVELMRNFGNL